MSEKQNKMAVMAILPLLWNMSLPLMFSLLVQSLYNIVDAVYVSRLSESALTATSLVYPVQFLMIAISVGTAVGLNSLMSRYVGQGDNHRAATVATTGFYLCLLTAAVFTVMGLFVTEPLSRLLTSDQTLQELTGTYMKICVVFCPGIFIDAFGQRMLTAVGLTKYSMISLVSGALTNILLDPVLIFGYFGIPSLGIAGAAIATVIGQWLGAIVALVLNYRKNPAIHLFPKNYRFHSSDVKDIYRIGLPMMIMQGIGTLMTASCNAVLINYSSTAVAFFGIYYKVQGFILMPLNGLGQAELPITAFNYGAGQYDRVKETWHITFLLAIGFSLIGVFAFEVLPAPLLGIFAASEEMMAFGVPAFRTIGLTFPLAAYTLSAGYFCTGLGDSKVNMISAFLRQFIILIPLLWLGAQLWGLTWCWLSFIAAESLAALYSCRVVKKAIKKNLSA